MKRIDPQDVGRAVLNRDRMVYLTIRELQDGGYLNCRKEVCRLTDKGKKAYVAAAEEWDKVR